MGSSLQTFVLFEFNNAETGEAKDVKQVLTRHLQTLNDLLVVSRVGITDDPGADHAPDAAWAYRAEFTVDKQVAVAHVYKPQLPKCARCWQYTVEHVKNSEMDDDHCPRCIDVVKRLDLET